MNIFSWMVLLLAANLTVTVMIGFDVFVIRKKTEKIENVIDYYYEVEDEEMQDMWCRVSTQRQTVVLLWGA